jgi:hypothetical protein
LDLATKVLGIATNFPWFKNSIIWCWCCEAFGMDWSQSCCFSNCCIGMLGRPSDLSFGKGYCLWLVPERGLYRAYLHPDVEKEDTPSRGLGWYHTMVGGLSCWVQNVKDSRLGWLPWIWWDQLVNAEV